jgi:hypothetical protein
MTQEEMIDYWQTRVNEFNAMKREAMVSNNFSDLWSFSALEGLSREIYMQLCHMETTKPVTPIPPTHP